jgi:beta-aspartyl-peptidase (threonine type)
MPTRSPALIIHGGAGVRGPFEERPARRRAMLDAAGRGRDILEAGGSALDAVCAAVVLMENNPLFNAGQGSALNADGEVEMDASLMAVPFKAPATTDGAAATVICAGAVAAVRRVRNPVLLARAVMEQTSHVLIIGAAAEKLALRADIALCRPEELITERARARWRRYLRQAVLEHGTVGAVALDTSGQFAAATSTGGITGKMAGRVGDSAIIGAGTFADRGGAASATGFGESIMKTTLCREVVRMLARVTPARAASVAIKNMEQLAGGEAGVIVVDSRGRIGYAHNAEAMDIAVFTPAEGIRHYSL